MRIDFMINSLVGGGAERVMVTLANGFIEHKHEVNLITFNKGNAYKTNSKVKRIDLHHGKIKNHSVRSLLNSFNYYRVTSNRPDILIAFIPSNNLIAILIGLFYGIKVIISEHNNHLANPSFKSKWIRKLLYRFADTTTVLTSFDKPFFENLGAKVVIMPNPINIPKTIKPFSERENTILVAGSLKRYQVKGFDVLLPIIAPILKSHPDWKLMIAGDGEPGLNILKKITAELNLSNQVVFLGFISNIGEVMQNAKIFALPSQYEGLPMVLMEALSNGMACIAYDCVSGPGDLINDQENGLLIENQDKEALQNGISTLIDDTNLMMKLSNNAIKGLTQYNLDNMIIRWEELIKNVLGKK
ncbi:glycosyltransferase family 4 protein [Maribacter sp. X9]|uniref:glycosyltransferase family 4 protein n=1 Tax=Maribacter sp. X9 TaxID=3402159 RepID=UPI003AF3D450